MILRVEKGDVLGWTPSISPFNDVCHRKFLVPVDYGKMITVNNKLKIKYWKEVQGISSGKKVRVQSSNILQTLWTKQASNTERSPFGDIRCHRFLIHLVIMVTENNQPKSNLQEEIQEVFSGKQVRKFCSNFTIKTCGKYYFWTPQRVCIIICNTVHLPETLPYYMAVNRGELFLAVIQ